ncbi:unnamed protein product [Medioppia subpectinata]|uniref:ABC transmembrane type-1 domain-containing protein n=1 Tax=Medioppia subpectinata TaxID=1979941 RepID=A0A7R9KVV0_9ACAR|nr:unnamed protein product [Medioppia subpectinata]CAG2110434.1 unnamed protein product [Medioppia subpectinata]
MGKLTLIAILLACVAVSLQSPTKQVDQMVDYINNLGTTWKAEKQFDDSYSLDYIKGLMGVPALTERAFGSTPAYDPELEIPETFDARTQWPTCASIKEVRDQGSCGSCWAFATVEAISDRICIASQGKQQVEVSAENLVACCSACGNGCRGGWPEQAWSYYERTGLVSGGLYASHVGCQPYSINACEHHVSGHLPPCDKELRPTPKCQHTCEAGYNGTYAKDLHFGKSSYGFSNENQALQQDIMKNGPVVSTFQNLSTLLIFYYVNYFQILFIPITLVIVAPLDRNQCPEPWIFPTWMVGVRKNGLDMDDMSRCPKAVDAQRICNLLEKNWRYECRKKRPKFWRALFWTFGKHYILPFCVFLFEESVIRIAQPILLGYVIDYFSGVPAVTYQEACVAAAGVCLCSALFITLHHPMLVFSQEVGMRMRIASCALMYKKSLKLSRASLGKTTVGQIVNIMSNDVNRFDEFSTFVHYLVLGPVQAVIVSYIMYTHLGWSAFVGVALLVPFIPFQLFIGKLFSMFR